MEEKKPISKNKKILNNILLTIEWGVIAVCIIFSIFVIAQPGEVGKNGTTKFLPVQTDSMTPTIPVGALVITDETDNKVYDLGTIVTFVASSGGLQYLDTHRIVGYSYKDENNATQIAYYKKGEIENASDFAQLYPNYQIKSYVTRGDKYTTEYGSMDDFGYTQPEKIGLTSPYLREGDVVLSVTQFDDNYDHPVSNVTFTAIYKTHVNGIGAVLTWFMQPTHFFIVILIPLILLFLYNAYGVVKIIIQLKVKKAKEETKLDEEEIKRRAIEEYLKSQNTAESAETSAEEPKETSAEEVKEETSAEGTEGSGE